MLGDAGSIASVVGVVVSLLGLGFAIWQLMKLRGETRAAREAAEATRRAVGRDLALADIGRMSERIQALKEFHRGMEWNRALSRYPDIQRGLVDIRRRYPGLSEADSEKLRLAMTRLQNMESTVEADSDDIKQETVSEFNRYLSELQLALAELESQLQQST